VTALCPGGGPSEPRPGEAVLKDFIGGAILDILVTGEMGWYGPIAAGVGYLAYNLTDLCTKDPPQMPDLTAQRLQSYLLDTQGAVNLRTDAYNLIGNILWRQYCQCVGGGAIPPVVVIQPPSGWELNDPNTNRPTGIGCRNDQSAFTTTAFDASGNTTITLLPDNNLNAAATWVQFDVNAGSVSGPNPYPVTWSLDQIPTGSSAIVSHNTWTQTADIFPENKLTYSFPLAPGGGTLRFGAHTSTGAGGSWGSTLQVRQYCGTQPPSIEQPCCPPDPTLENLIVQVLRLEQLILDSLGGKPGYTKGTVHPNLQGSNSIPVTGLHGVLIDVTSGTPTTPQLEGVPPYEWNLGWLSIMTGDGFVDEKRITRQHQVWQSALVGEATVLGYFLHPGVVATITELGPPP